MFIEKLLQLMAEKKASDLFISAGSPISIKITGTIMPVNPQVMDAETTKKISARRGPSATQAKARTAAAPRRM